jgi:hypothetical protein
MKTDQRVVMLTPCNESYDGPQYSGTPAEAGDVPKDNLGIFSMGGTAEVSDSEFRSWPEKE